jgi:hypothetical protein
MKTTDDILGFRLTMNIHETHKNLPVKESSCTKFYRTMEEVMNKINDETSAYTGLLKYDNINGTPIDDDPAIMRMYYFFTDCQTSINIDICIVDLDVAICKKDALLRLSRMPRRIRCHDNIFTLHYSCRESRKVSYIELAYYLQPSISDGVKNYPPYGTAPFPTWQNPYTARDTKDHILSILSQGLTVYYPTVKSLLHLRDKLYASPDAVENDYLWIDLEWDGIKSNADLNNHIDNYYAFMLRHFGLCESELVCKENVKV